MVKRPRSREKKAEEGKEEESQPAACSSLWKDLHLLPTSVAQGLVYSDASRPTDKQW